MAAQPSVYRTSPDHELTGYPPGVPFIIGNEGCERFSFYGMKSILAVYMASLYALGGMGDEASKAHATETVHIFITGVYAFPMIGALLADRLLGKYNTIFWLSLVYTAGHAVLAMFDDTVGGMYTGLALIAVGSGGIKPCVSATVGDQFGRGNWHKLSRVYQYFYFSINFGSFFATLLIPWTKEHYGSAWAFGIPGILMAIATLVFWLGRRRYVHVPASPGGRLGLYDVIAGSLLFVGTLGVGLFGPSDWSLSVKLAGGAIITAAGLAVFQARQKMHQDDGFLAVFLYTLFVKLGLQKEAAPLPGTQGPPDPGSPDLRKHAFFGPAARRFGQEAAEGPLAVVRIMTIFIFVSMFWALFDQHSSTWIFQAEQMDRVMTLPYFGQIELLPSQIPAANPVMVMGLIPFVGFILYPLMDKTGFKSTPLRRMSIGMFMAAAAYVSVALIQEKIDAAGIGQVPVAWQLIPFLIMTLSEVMVSITGLEFAYSQAPKRMKSTIMGFWLLSVSLGNKLVAVLSELQSDDLAGFFWLFAALMAGFAVLFSLRAMLYHYRDYTQ